MFTTKNITALIQGQELCKAMTRLWALEMIMTADMLCFIIHVIAHENGES